MYAVAVDEVLQRVIDHPVAGHARLAFKQGRGNANPEMRAKACAIGAGVAFVLPAFVQHLERARLQLRAQALGHAVGQGGAHVDPPGGASMAGSSWMWRAT